MPVNSNHDETAIEYLFVLSSLNLYIFGGSRIVFELAKGLKTRGKSVGIVYMRDLYGFLSSNFDRRLITSYLKKKGVKSVVYRVAPIFINNLIFYKFFLPIIRKVLRIDSPKKIEGLQVLFGLRSLDRYRIENTIATYWDTAKFSLLIKSDRHYHFVQGLEYMPEFTGKISVLAESSLNLPTHKIVINEKLCYKFGLPKESKVRVGIDHGIFRCKVPPDERKPNVVLFQLMVHPVKGGSLAVETINEIVRERPDIRILAFGNFKSASVPRSVHHFGYISEERLSELFNQSSIFVISSILEGTPLPGLQAMSCGTAVVSTDNIGIKEYINSGENGIIVEEMTPNTLKAAICDLVDNPLLRLKMISLALERAKEFTYDNMVSDFLKSM